MTLLMRTTLILLINKFFAKKLNKQLDLPALMCGRFSLITVSEFLSDRFKVRVEEELVPRYNIAPGQYIPAILSEAPRKISMVRWGLIPNWSKDEKVGYKMINARAETLEERNAYKVPFRRMRCLIPADGFYEWKNADGMKIPYRITLQGGELFAFAGIYDHWKHDEEEIVSCSIITTSPNKIVAPIHDRMPVVLNKDDEDKWLGDVPADELVLLLRPYAGEMKTERISELVNSPKNDTEEVIKPVKSLLDY